MEPLNLEDDEDAYFRDGKRRVDYVLVITRVSAHRHNKLLTNYINNLQEAGLQFEQCYGITEPVVFVKIHIPQDTFQFMEQKIPAWKATLMNNTEYSRQKFRGWQKHMITPLQNMEPLDREDICSRIYYISEIIKSTRYGEGDLQQGIGKLLDRKIIHNAFPLHDGRIQYDLWEYDELLNTRTLLAKYWADIRCFYKTQPLDMIKHYFGIEIAFYFAWRGFYIKVLTPLVIFSFMMLTWSFVRYPIVIHREHYLEDFCKKDTIMLCGYCYEDREECETLSLRDFCDDVSAAIIFEYKSYLYAMVVSVWSGFVGMMWKRYELSLRKRWNLEDVEHQLDERFLYKKEQKNRRRSYITDQIEAFTPIREKFFKKFVCVVFVLSVGLFFLTFLLVNINFTTYLKTKVTLHIAKKDLVFDTVSMGIQFVFIRLQYYALTKLCRKVAKFVRNKYQQEHDRTFLLLRYACAFWNQYLMFFYFAFFKGNFYNVPKKVTSWSITYDKCQLDSCMDVLLIVVNMVSVFFLGKKIYEIMRQNIKIKKRKPVILPQFEKESKFTHIYMYTLQVAFIQSMVRHGFLVFFATGNFLSVIFMWAISIIGERYEAYRLIHEAQRPVPKVIYNVHSWNAILIFITTSSVFINGCVSMFTSEAFDMLVYERTHFSLKGYWEYRLSLFNQRDLYGEKVFPNQTCYYRSQRFPPEHPHKYDFTIDYWNMISNKLKGLLAFEFLVIVIIMITYFVIDNIFKAKKTKKFINDSEIFSRHKHDSEESIIN